VSDFIPVAEPDLSTIERDKLLDAFDSGWISSTGSYVDQFEEQWAVESGCKYALSVSNGTVALHLILAALGIGPGDEVIVPSLTFIATANAVTYVGAKVVFADSDPDTWCIDTISISALITPKTKAVIGVHLYGNPIDIYALREICSNYGIFLIEDAAEAPFTKVGQENIGSLGIAASFSFYGNKVITSGEGGAVTTSDFQLYKKMKLLRGQGMDPNRRYFFSEIGFNFRLTNMQCAILCGQLDRKTELLYKRDKIFETYDGILRENSKIEFQKALPNHTQSPWLYSIVLRDLPDTARDMLANDLRNLDIETRPFFIPLHLLPPYHSHIQKSLPVCEDLSARGISLPTSSKLLPEKAEYVAKSLLEALEKY
jgi:perosamine synthetase